MIAVKVENNANYIFELMGSTLEVKGTNGRKLLAKSYQIIMQSRVIIGINCK